MPVHMLDSQIYGSAWGSDAMRLIFDEQLRTQAWLDIIATLAEAQAELGIIPSDCLPEIRRVCNLRLLDLSAVQRGYQQTGHSMLGLIHELKRLCRNDAGEWIYYGATVQDITDTWLSQALVKVWYIIFNDLRDIEFDLLQLAETHRDTPMAGRTHGQIGLPITFGFKVAVWVREIRRHIERLKEIKKRMGEGQLCGGVGSASSSGANGLRLQQLFCSKLGLRAPDIAWINSRDTHAEFLNLLALIAATFDKIGQEVFTLQRPEICELREGLVTGTVGSITMPHKRNPEIAEHLGTLARMIRHDANCMTESLVHSNERDARSWKVEWSVVPTACTMAGGLLTLAKKMCANLEVDDVAMLRNLDATQGQVLSEGIMLALAQHVGKQTAHDLMYTTSMQAHESYQPLREAVESNEAIVEHLSHAELNNLFDYRQQLGQCPQFVDRVAAMTRSVRKQDLPYG